MPSKALILLRAWYFEIQDLVVFVISWLFEMNISRPSIAYYTEAAIKNNKAHNIGLETQYKFKAIDTYEQYSTKT